MQVYLVGGAVRDALMGLATQDHDWVVVGATPKQLLDQGYTPVGQDFPVFLHPRTKDEYALARTERSTGPGYKAFAVVASPEVTLEEDLGRRDLTINSIAVHAYSVRADGTFDTENLCDPYGGQRDIANKVLRHTTQAFTEDPVRILRLARFAARFNDFTVAPETLALTRHMVGQGDVDHLVAERVWQELARGLMDKQPSRMFAVLRDCGALEHLLPELDRLWAVPQSKEQHPEVATGLHRMRVLDLAAHQGAPLSVRFATLTLDLGKDTALRDISQRLRVPTECTELAQVVAREHGNIHRCASLSPDATLHLLERCDAIRKPARFADILQACECDARGRLGLQDTRYPQARRLADALRVAMAVPTQAIADEAMSKGITGTTIGALIHDARAAAIASALQIPPEDTL